MRMLDRTAGPDAPRHVCIDPRRTKVAEVSEVHLAVRPGTNQAVMNGLIREVIHRGWVDSDWVEAHTVGFDELAKTVEPYTPQQVAEICQVQARDVERAAEVFGTSERVVSTVLQGFYQSHQATAASVQVNNLHLLRGMLGRPGCGVLQMNGQPTAENTRECGANGDLPGFRNWANENHVTELAELWNVEPDQIPHWAPSTHAMQMFRYAEEGSLKFLWISGTNPAVSLPDLHRIRSILARERLFTVVQDLFLTETAVLADVVLPAATWGEKTGCFTNADRTVHLSDKAVDPPGMAMSDLDIFLDYARRMDFRDKDGRPLVHWTDADTAFEAWKACSAGRPCDYTGLSHVRLRSSPSGIQWPCTEERPEGTERLYSGGRFWAAPGTCESYGKDLVNGAELGATKYKAWNPDGKALLRGAEYTPPPEPTDEEHPLWLTTGRTIYHFHTRTKTARAPQLNKAAPDVWVEMSPGEAARRGLEEGDLAEVTSARGVLRARVRVSHIRDGVLFVPFHYGYFDVAGGPPAERDDPGRAANETSLTAWDPVSKQPLYKTCAASVALAEAAPGDQARGAPSSAPTTGASAPADEPTSPIPPTVGGPEAEATSVWEED